MYSLYGCVLVFLAAGSFGASAIVIKLAYQTGLQPAQLLTLQNCVALLCMWPLLVFTYGLPRLKASQLRSLFFQGIFGNFGISVCYFWAAQRMDISLLTIIMFTYPGVVLLYGVLVEKRQVRFVELLSLGAAGLGCVFAVDPFHITFGEVDRWGLILGIGAALTYAFINIHGEKLARELPSQVVTTFSSTISTLGMLIVFPPALVFQSMPSWSQWELIIISALLCTVVPMNLIYMGIRRVGAFYASVISVSELPVTLWLAYFILGEHLNGWQLLGGILILSSVLLLQVKERITEEAKD
jgi:drug/metabolite transporter (DMT)-like permease